MNKDKERQEIIQDAFDRLKEFGFKSYEGPLDEVECKKILSNVFDLGILYYRDRINQFQKRQEELDKQWERMQDISKRFESVIEMMKENRKKHG